MTDVREEVEALIRSEGNLKIWLSNGLVCVIRRHPSMKHLCGYVGVPKTHKFYNKPYDSLPDVDVHGGITYSDFKGGNLYFFGFDCAHCGDLIPDKNFSLSSDETYKDMVFVTNECEKLARTLKRIGGKNEVG